MTDDSTPILTVGQLREALSDCGIPDDSPVLVSPPWGEAGEQYDLPAVFTASGLSVRFGLVRTLTIETA